MTEGLPTPAPPVRDHACADTDPDVVPRPPATGHESVDEVLARADEQLAGLPDTDLAARREVLDEAHRTLRELLDSPLPAESAQSPDSAAAPAASPLPGDA